MTKKGFYTLFILNNEYFVSMDKKPFLGVYDIHGYVYTVGENELKLEYISYGSELEIYLGDHWAYWDCW